MKTVLTVKGNRRANTGPELPVLDQFSNEESPTKAAGRLDLQVDNRLP